MKIIYAFFFLSVNLFADPFSCYLDKKQEENNEYLDLFTKKLDVNTTNLRSYNKILGYRYACEESKIDFANLSFSEIEIEISSSIERLNSEISHLSSFLDTDKKCQQSDMDKYVLNYLDGKKACYEQILEFIKNSTN